MSGPQDPFWELPTGLKTGLVRQFTPRINSNSTVERVMKGAFPSGCYQRPVTLYFHYGSPRDVFTLDVCMPDDMRKSPWKPQRTRQDFRKETFLQVDFRNLECCRIP